jgi:hypothetical protein
MRVVAGVGLERRGGCIYGAVERAASRDVQPEDAGRDVGATGVVDVGPEWGARSA